MELTDVKSQNWQLGIKGFGDIAIDADDIALCIHNILFTRKGDVPLMPRFGSSIFEMIDRPVTEVRPKIVSEIIDAVGAWEPRIAITGVSSFFNSISSQLTFTLSATVISSSLPFQYSLSLAVS